MKESNIVWARGSGKRKSNEQKLLETLKKYRIRQIEYEEKREILGERNSYSKTDTDATFMRMKDDHMQNGQLKPGYNVQLAVESEYIIGAGLFPDANDVWTLKPMLENMYVFKLVNGNQASNRRFRLRKRRKLPISWFKKNQKAATKLK